ncbi:hypothetical protein EAI_15986 [Harpegnathos saltator]|uniref:Uncharacterized protein n=1 Tax=Harpegnathos saltator TaxID=610380 RepID=E2BG36_HARSA|nr:hypothetical protein EAI_15986 [Harpegnathos saltator]
MLWYRLEALYDTQPRPAIVITAHYTNTPGTNYFTDNSSKLLVLAHFSFPLRPSPALGTLPPNSFASVFALSPSRAGLGAANYPGHRYFLPRIKTDNRIITKIKVLNFVTFSLIKEVTIKQTCQLDNARTG